MTDKPRLEPEAEGKNRIHESGASAESLERSPLPRYFVQGETVRGEPRVYWVEDRQANLYGCVSDTTTDKRRAERWCRKLLRDGPTIPLHFQPPKIGSVYRTICPPRETRHVVDRTFGGDVIYVVGRYTRFAQRHTVTIENWRKWEKTARCTHDAAKAEGTTER